MRQYIAQTRKRPRWPIKIRIPVKSEKSDDQILITFKSGKHKKLQHAVFIKYMANLENSLPLEEVKAESKSDF